MSEKKSSKKESIEINSILKNSIREEKPTRHERITLEFNAIYNELLVSIRDRDTNASQEKFISLYNIYRKISSEKLSKSEKQALERQLKDIAALVPTENPPKIALPLAIIACIAAVLLFVKPEITGLAVFGQEEISIYPEISASGISVYHFDMEYSPERLSVSGGISSTSEGSVRIYLVDGSNYYLIAEEKVSNGVKNFEDVCIETCSLRRINPSGAALLVEAANAAVAVNEITYSG